MFKKFIIALCVLLSLSASAETFVEGKDYLRLKTTTPAAPLCKRIFSFSVALLVSISNLLYKHGYNKKAKASTLTRPSDFS